LECECDNCIEARPKVVNILGLQMTRCAGFRASFVSISIALMGCPLKPPPPKLVQTPVPVATLPESRVDLRISVPLQTVREQIDAAVPKTFGAADFNEGINGGADHCCDGRTGAGGVSAGWALSRDSFQLKTEGSTLLLDVDIRYDLAGRTRVPCCGVLCPAQCLGGLVTGSCGRNGEERRRAHLGFRSTIELLPDWRLQSKTTAAVSAIDRCQVLFVNRDITDLVMGAAQRAVDKESTKVDEKIAALPLRAKVEAAWSATQAPVEIEKGLWLEPNVIGAVTQPLMQEEDRLVVGVGLRAKPRLTVTGSSPRGSEAGLPPLERGSVGDAFVVAMPVDFSFKDATEQLRRAFHVSDGGMRIPAVGKPYALIEDVEIYGAGTTAVLRVDFDGSASGQAYFVGQPIYDAAAETIKVEDLDFSVETKNLLLKGADWFVHSDVRQMLAERAQFRVAAALDKAKTDVNRALTRDIGPVKLKGALTDLRVLSVTAMSSEHTFRSQVMLSGVLAASMN
jgi:hypothetical protein